MELLLNLDHSTPKTRAMSLAVALQEALRTGRLRPGQRLPSVRELSKVLSLARATVLRAYGSLEEEGLITTVPGAGTFVSRSAACKVDSSSQPTDSQQETETQPSKCETRTVQKVSLSSFARSLSLQDNQWVEPDTRVPRDDLEISKLWKRHLIRNWRTDLKAIFESSPEKIIHSLKGAISTYLCRARQLSTRAEQIVLAQSKSTLIDLVLRLVLKPDSVVIAGEGLSKEIARLFIAHGANIVTLAVDENGIELDSLTASGMSPALIYINPSHHNPCGVTLSEERRRQVIAFAKQTGAFILEDDLESQSQLPNHNRQLLHPRLPEQVFYFPSLTEHFVEVRDLGVMVVPAGLTGKFSNQALENDLFLVELMILKELLSSGELELSLRSKTKTLASKRRCLIYALTRHARDFVELVTQTNCRKQALRIKNSDKSDSQIIALGANFGISLDSTKNHYDERVEKREFILSLDEVEEANIEESVKAWADAINE